MKIGVPRSHSGRPTSSRPSKIWELFRRYRRVGRLATGRRATLSRWKFHSTGLAFSALGLSGIPKHSNRDHCISMLPQFCHVHTAKYRRRWTACWNSIQEGAGLAQTVRNHSGFQIRNMLRIWKPLWLRPGNPEAVVKAI